MNIYQKLLKVKETVPYLKKDKKGYNYTYVTPSQLFATINPILIEQGLLLVTNVISSTSKEIITGKGEKQKTEWKYDLDFVFDWVDAETGEKISIPWKASGVNGEDKGLGSALTYAERYFILKQFNIPTDDDDPDSFQDKFLTAAEKKAHEKERAEQEQKERKMAEEKKKKEIADATATLVNAKTVEELGSAYKALNENMKQQLKLLTTDLKAKLSAAQPNVAIATGGEGATIVEGVQS